MLLEAVKLLEPELVVVLLLLLDTLRVAESLFDGLLLLLWLALDDLLLDELLDGLLDLLALLDALQLFFIISLILSSIESVALLPSSSSLALWQSSSSSLCSSLCGAAGACCGSPRSSHSESEE